MLVDYFNISIICFMILYCIVLPFQTSFKHVIMYSINKNNDNNHNDIITTVTISFIKDSNIIFIPQLSNIKENAPIDSKKIIIVIIYLLLDF